MWPYPWTHVGTPSHLGHMDRVAATMPSQAHAGAAQEAPDIGQWGGQDVPLGKTFFLQCQRRHPELPKIPTYLPVPICFGVAPHNMPDHVVTLAWRTRPHKIRSQIHELTCEACHVHYRRGFGANDGIFLGMDLWYISPLYITSRFDTCTEHLNICRMHF